MLKIGDTLPTFQLIIKTEIWLNLQISKEKKLVVFFIRKPIRQVVQQKLVTLMKI